MSVSRVRENLTHGSTRRREETNASRPLPRGARRLPPTRPELSTLATHVRAREPRGSTNPPIALATVLGVSGSSAPALHRHGRRVHEHPYARAHRHLRLIQRSQPVERSADHYEHGHHHHGEHGHSHGLVDRSILRSRAGLKAVSISLGVLGATAL